MNTATAMKLVKTKHKTLQQYKLLSATLYEKTWSLRWPVLLA